LGERAPSGNVTNAPPDRRRPFVVVETNGSYDTKAGENVNTNDGQDRDSGSEAAQSAIKIKLEGAPLLKSSCGGTIRVDESNSEQIVRAFIFVSSLHHIT